MLHLRTEIAAYPQFQAEDLSIDIGHRDGAIEIWMLNLMPLKTATEEDLCRMLAASGLDINLHLLKFPQQQYKTTPKEYIDAHYETIDSLMLQQKCDGLIITGAPLENIAFEEVRYWKELCQLMDWSTQHCRSTLNICWAAQAALYHHAGVKKHPLAQKKFGIYPQTVVQTQHPLMQQLTPDFPMPHSRHTEIRSQEFPPEVQVIASGEQSGAGVMEIKKLKQVFVTGHLEYNKFTLDKEYKRDLAKGLPIAIAQNYYEANDPLRPICFSWDEAAKRFYRNWLLTLR